MKPFTPDEAVASKLSSIPDAVIETVNKLLSMRYSNGGRASFRISEIVGPALEQMQAQGIKVSKDDFFSKKWLDFEDVYRKQGWKVVYDNPGCCEDYEGYWEFTRAK